MHPFKFDSAVGKLIKTSWLIFCNPTSTSLLQFTKSCTRKRILLTLKLPGEGSIWPYEFCGYIFWKFVRMFPYVSLLYFRMKIMNFRILKPATREEILTWKRPGSIGVSFWDKATYPFMSLSLFLTIFNPYTKTKICFYCLCISVQHEKLTR